LFYKIVHTAGYSQDQLMTAANRFFALFALGYAINQIVLLKKRNFNWLPIAARAILSLLFISLIGFLVYCKHDAEGIDIAFMFFLALASGYVVYPEAGKPSAKIFFTALFVWLFIIFINEMAIQSLLPFRKAEIGDIINNMAGVFIGLMFSNKWFWVKK